MSEKNLVQEKAQENAIMEQVPLDLHNIEIAEKSTAVEVAELVTDGVQKHRVPLHRRAHHYCPVRRRPEPHA